ncbi:MAG: hypothetical protein FWD47_04745, partial [Treponema sp.]|nr:hypothetical protein [Treponema sp.]
TADNINFPVVQMYRTSNAKSLCSKYLAYGCELTISNYRNITNLCVVRGNNLKNISIFAASGTFHFFR